MVEVDKEDECESEEKVVELSVNIIKGELTKL